MSGLGSRVLATTGIHVRGSACQMGGSARSSAWAAVLETSNTTPCTFRVPSQRWGHYVNWWRRLIRIDVALDSHRRRGLISIDVACICTILYETILYETGISYIQYYTKQVFHRLRAGRGNSGRASTATNVARTFLRRDCHRVQLHARGKGRARRELPSHGRRGLPHELRPA